MVGNKNTTSINNNTSMDESKGVSFGEVRVRVHERILNRRASAMYAGLELG